MMADIFSRAYSQAIPFGIICKGYPENPFSFMTKENKGVLFGFGDESFNGSWENGIRIREENLCIM